MSEILHEGKRLKFLIKTNPKKSKDIANSMNYKRLQGLAYYYRQPHIKKDTLYKFLDTLGIDENEFYNKKTNYTSTETQNIVNEDATNYVSNRSMHHGKNLKRLLEQRFINISALCDALQLNRANFYSYFKEPTLPEWLILQVCTILEIPASKITGENVAEKKFDKLVYDQLNQIQKQLNVIISKI